MFLLFDTIILAVTNTKYTNPNINADAFDGISINKNDDVMPNINIFKVFIFIFLPTKIFVALFSFISSFINPTKEIIYNGTVITDADINIVPILMYGIPFIVEPNDIANKIIAEAKKIYHV